MVITAITNLKEKKSMDPVIVDYMRSARSPRFVSRLCALVPSSFENIANREAERLKHPLHTVGLRTFPALRYPTFISP